MTDANLTLLHGDPYFCGRELRQRHRALVERDPALERRPLFTDEIDWPAWGIELRSSALFVPSRHFIVRAAGKAPAPSPLLQAMAGDLAPNTYVTLVFPPLRSSSPLLKGFAKMGSVVALPAPKPRGISREVSEILRQAGCAPQPALVQELVDRNGGDLLQHAQEAKKLATYLGTESDVTAQRVPDALLYTAGERSVWALLDHIGERDVAAAFGELSRLHEDPGRIMAMAIRHLARLTAIRALRDERVPRSEVATITGNPEWRLRKLVRQTDAWEARGLRAALRSSIALDVSVKDGERRAGDALVEMILATTPPPA